MTDVPQKPEPEPQFDPALRPEGMPPPIEGRASPIIVTIAALAAAVILTMVLYGLNDQENPGTVASNTPPAGAASPAAASQGQPQQQASQSQSKAPASKAPAGLANAQPPAASAKPAPANTNAAPAPASQSASNPPGSNTGGNSKQNNAGNNTGNAQDKGPPPAKPNG